MVKQKLFNAQKQTPKAYSHLKQDCLYLPAEMIHKGIFFFFLLPGKVAYSAVAIFNIFQVWDFPTWSWI